MQWGGGRPGLVALMLLAAAHAFAAEPLRLCLNWAPGADHAPWYFGRAEGWFAEAGLALELEPGGGSGAAVSRVLQGGCEAALADFGSVLESRGRQGPVLAVMASFTDSPLAFFTRSPRRLDGPGDLAGLRAAASPGELARRLWPWLAQGNTASGVIWVDLPNNAKVAALASGAVDVVANSFYHHALEFERAFGADLHSLRWRDHGRNPHSQVLVVTEALAQARPERVSRLVQVAQRAHLACVARPQRCLDALLGSNPHLDADDERARWALAAPLVAPPGRSGAVFGRLVPERVRSDPRIGTLDPEGAVTNRFLSPEWRLP